MSLMRSTPRRGVRAGRVAACMTVLLLAGCGSGGSDSPAAGTDWRNTAYPLTCDGAAPGGFRARVVDGEASVPADAARPPYYDSYEVAVVSTADGDVDGDGRDDTVVLLTCSPQPSNGILQEVLAFSAHGRRLGSLPSPRTLQGDAPLPPEYVPDGLTVEGGDVVARMTAYAPDDSHADGPSIPITVRWRYVDGDFERISPT